MTEQGLRKKILKTWGLTILLFIVIGIISHFFFSNNLELAQQQLEQFQEMVGEGIVNDDGTISARGLFFNNLRATLMAVVLGVVPFIFLPLWVLVANGAIIGSLSFVVSQGGFNPLIFYGLGLLPHGIFEIPTICLGVALGTQLCLFITRKILRRETMAFRELPRIYGSYIIKIMLPLLLVAALVEAYVTPLILQMGLGL